MNIPSEVADIRMRTESKNLMTTARTTHLPNQKEAIHMTSMLRKDICSGSIHDLPHIPTQNCLADCLTKSMDGESRQFDQNNENREIIGS